jgi:ERCC4-type nuclease
VSPRPVVDTREPEPVADALDEIGVAVTRRRLPVGDYVIGELALVERKTVRGFHADIVAGTFWPQIGRLRDSARFAYLLIEGPDLDSGQLAPAAVRGACIALMDIGVAIIRSADLDDSALWLQRLALRRAEYRYRNVPAYAQRPKRAAGASTAEAALAAVPGISRVCAQRLLRHFGTLAAVVLAPPTSLQAVHGIGPTRAKALTEAFHTPATASRSRHRDRPDPAT